MTMPQSFELARKRLIDTCDHIDTPEYVSASLVYHNVRSNPNVVTILFEKDYPGQPDVRTLAVTGDTKRILGLTREQMEGALLSEYVPIPIAQVRKWIQDVDRDGFMIKHMMNTASGEQVRAMIAKESDGRYLETIWRIKDEK